jgi:hypothetical protein
MWREAVQTVKNLETFRRNVQGRRREGKTMADGYWTTRRNFPDDGIVYLIAFQTSTPRPLAFIRFCYQTLMIHIKHSPPEEAWPTNF